MKTSFDADHVSDELLNAFVDNELDRKEHLQLLQAQLKDPAIHLRICELRQIKELVGSARHQEPSNHDSSRQTHTRGRKSRSIAASVMFLVTIGIIVFMAQPSWLKPDNTRNYTYAYPQIKVVLNKLDTRNKTNIVFHINKNNMHSLEALFTDIQRLLIDPRTENKNIRIEVLTSGPGLPLLDTLSEKHRQLIQQLYTQHENISFIVCKQTLTKFRKKTKKLKQLPKGMVLTASAPELIKLRRAQGWNYIHI